MRSRQKNVARGIRIHEPLTGYPSLVPAESFCCVTTMATDPSKFSDQIDQGLFNAIAEGNLELVKHYAEQGANLKRAMDPEGDVIPSPGPR